MGLCHGPIERVVGVAPGRSVLYICRPSTGCRRSSPFRRHRALGRATGRSSPATERRDDPWISSHYLPRAWRVPRMKTTPAERTEQEAAAETLSPLWPAAPRHLPWSRNGEQVRSGCVLNRATGHTASVAAATTRDIQSPAFEVHLLRRTACLSTLMQHVMCWQHPGVPTTPRGADKPAAPTRTIARHACRRSGRRRSSPAIVLPIMRAVEVPSVRSMAASTVIQWVLDI